ncbi:PREDICTED: uncharacterized protein LOC104826709 [Tarenaya hassleriana]|uniref:uncharacterized protein LOC104826709 n=1 Tax=Tarenaya hassleriana TaxID=28532 RepID=UPI00053C4288|nr:PREDICTED: uncharacterized protein LOC104826709 [Tarenaya hassleriana]
MASLFVTLPTHSLRTFLFASSRSLIPPANRFSGGFDSGVNWRKRGCVVLTRAGASASSYLLAFAIPATLVAVTVFASIKIADKLDEDFFEEVALTQSLREEALDGEEDAESESSLDEMVQEPVLQRTRNRPKREV